MPLGQAVIEFKNLSFRYGKAPPLGFGGWWSWHSGWGVWCRGFGEVFVFFWIGFVKSTCYLKTFGCWKPQLIMRASLFQRVCLGSSLRKHQLGAVSGPRAERSRTRTISSPMSPASSPWVPGWRFLAWRGERRLGDRGDCPWWPEGHWGYLEPFLYSL